LSNTDYSSERRIAINAASRYGATAFRTLVILILTPYLIREVGIVFYGLQSLAGQALQFVALASTAIGVSYDRFATEKYARNDIDGMNSALSVGLLLSLGSAFLYAICTVIVAFNAKLLFDLDDALVPTARTVFLITGFAATAHMLYKVWLAPVFITQRFYLDAIASIIASSMSLVSVWIAFQYLTPSIVIWVIITSLLRIGVEVLFIMPFCRKALPEVQPRLHKISSRAQIKEMTGFSALSLLGGLGHLLFYATDSIMIANLDELGTEDIAYYSVAQRWDPQIHFLILSFVSVLAPIMVTDAARGNFDRLRNTYTRATRYCLILGMYPCLVLAIFSEGFFRHWLGESFVEICPPIMRLILMSLLLSIPCIVGYEILMAKRAIGKVVFGGLLGGLCNIVLSVFLVKQCNMGLLGIAVGSVTTMFITQSVLIPMMVRSHVKLSLKEFFWLGCAKAVVGAVPMVVVGILMVLYWPAQSLVMILFQMALCGLVYAAGVWTLSLDTRDRRKVSSAARQVIAKLQRLSSGGRS
jgi:O-antigen/teichoic acid export membrane protein